MKLSQRARKYSIVRIGQLVLSLSRRSSRCGFRYILIDGYDDDVNEDEEDDNESEDR
jgi:hypothetical protein